MVPDRLRNLNPAAYTPRTTSIGPLHKKDHHLKAMEELKVTYMYRLFCRTVTSTNQTMKKITLKCVKAVLGQIGRARACYAPSFTNYDDWKLAEIMVIDGCFILELLYRSKHRIGEGDPIFGNILVKHEVKNDLLLLENQMPFFILETLFSLTVKPILKFTSISLTDLMFDFFKDMNILDDSEFTLENGTGEHCHLLGLNFFKDMNISNNSSEVTLENGTAKHCHILGLLQSCYKPRGTECHGVPNKRYSATEIAGAGVTFKPQKNKESLLAVKFEESPFVPCCGKLFINEASFKIPVLCIKYSTLSFLQNLIAYEQCYALSCHYVTSLAFLMDMLIDSKDDVSLLVRANVLQHKLGACEDVTNLFNSICNGVVLRDFYYSDEWTKLDDYRKSCLPKILSKLSHLYKTTTWKTLTVIAAMAIFALTVLQTIYDV